MKGGLCKNCKHWQRVDEMGWCRLAKDAPIAPGDNRKVRTVAHVGFRDDHREGEAWHMPATALHPLLDRLRLRRAGALYTKPEFGCNQFEAKT